MKKKGKKKKKNSSEEDRTSEKEEEKKKSVGQKLRLSGSLITHNSKIRELSNENKKLKTELWLAKQTFFLELRWVPPFLRIELWKLRIER